MKFFPTPLLILVVALVPIDAFAQQDSPPVVVTCSPSPAGPTVVVDGGTEFVTPPTFLPPTGPSDARGDRYVYFAHGFGGAETSWSKGRTELDDRSLADLLRIKATFNATYLSKLGLSDGSSSWKGLLKSAADCRVDNVVPTENIVVAHSFGGLVGRYVYDKISSDPNLPYADRPYDGLITFDAPHAGAGFANNLSQVDDFVELACNELSIGPALAAAASLPIVPWFENTAESVENLTTSLCGGVVAPFANQALKIFGVDGGTGTSVPSTSNDLKTGSVALSQLNSSSTLAPAHQIAVYSNETQEGLVWRVLYWAVRDNTNNYEFGQANCDGPLVADSGQGDCPGQTMFNTAGMWEADYTAKANDWLAQARDKKCFLRIKACVNKRQLWRDTGNAYRRGATWLRNADPYFKDLGGFVRTTSTSAGCDCLVDGLPGQSRAMWSPIRGNFSDCRAACNAFAWPSGATVIESRPVGGISVTALENDGIVTVESQRAWGTHKWDYQGSNHFQVRNDRTTASVFQRALFLGDDDTWFSCQRF